MFKKIMDGLKDASIVMLVLSGVAAFVIVAVYFKGITPECQGETVSALWLGGM